MYPYNILCSIGKGKVLAVIVEIYLVVAVDTRAPRMHGRFHLFLFLFFFLCVFVAFRFTVEYW